MATLRDVAALAGVSVKTVSNVVNGFEFVRPSTREKVNAAIAELGYQPNLVARNLRAGKTGVIGLAVPELRFSYFAELAGAVLDAARRREYVVLIEQTGGERSAEIELLHGSRISMMDGLLFSPLGLSGDDVRELEVDYPLVLLGERIFNGPTDHVAIQNVEGAALAVRHLLASGRRRIAVLGAHEGEKIGSAALRLGGYRSALEQAGVPFDPSLVVYREGWHRTDGAEAMQELIGRNVQFDAVFALNDELGLGALRTLFHSGRRVPEDVAVVGFDNVTEAQFAMPSLATVDPNRAKIAQIAVDALLERIAWRGKEDDPSPRAFEVPATLVARESAPAAVRSAVA
ncbi:LacI family DNA-binding transcriptional regulator [Sinomonas sp. ASV322]|uniref:LacI family DNA-binding transcriptional regulator n=1 Tax=Sinomonas sp. ASV322 TaxID=3041920 RepID=UPI0027DAE9F6|nr:LacI family DNA-binding transcriptional regulator [Sinomonas sp. ASV322]MDQ4502363.1 LacI family DNA-binding transcriptional regulator [Sinomonas sp. ASV322]